MQAHWGNLTAQQIKQTHVDELIHSTKKGYAHSTAYHVAYDARRFLATQGRQDLACKVKPPRPRAIVPTPEELLTLKANAVPFMRAWLILAAELGLRIAETLQVSDATHDPKAQTITVLAKGKRPRVLPTTTELESFFNIAPRAADTTTPLIARLAGRKTIDQGQIRSSWKQLKDSLGIRVELHPHDLRRSAAERLYKQTRDLRSVQRLLGHQNLQSTLAYLEHYDPENLRPLIEALRIPTEAVQ